MTLAGYLAFLGVAGVLALTPGPDTFLSLRYALHSRRLGFWTATGSSIAVFAWAALAAVGLVALLRASTLAYQLLTLAGGAYLLFLGVRALMQARKGRSASPAETAQAPATGRGPFLAGVLTCLTNPKTGLFFVALFPQFVPGDMHPGLIVLLLGGTVALVIYGYLLALVMVVDAASSWLANPRVSWWLELGSGTILGALGLAILVPAFLALPFATIPS